MRVGTIVLQTQPWSGMAESFRTAEQIGYDVAYVADHLTHPSIGGHWLADGFAVLAAAATVTTRVDLGTLVASAVIRNPVSLALWAGEPDFVGDHAAYRDVLTAPVAPGRGRPFTMIAAHGPRGLALAAAHGDAWSTFGGAASVPLVPDEFWDLLATQSAALTRTCEALQRDPASVRRSVLLGYGTVQPLADVSSYVAAVERAEAAGFDEVVVYWPDGQPGDRFWSDPDVHAEALTRLAY